MKKLFVLMCGLLFCLLPACGVPQKFDTLVNKDETCEQKWADYEAQLQRRADLIPNAVEIVKASAAHEHSVLTEVAAARAGATQIKLTGEDLTNPEKVAAFEKAQNQLKGSLSRLMMVQEQYPDLKASSAFHDLNVQLEGTENRILRSREQYNASVGDYNRELKRISGRVVNPLTGGEFKPRVYFKAAPEATVAPKINMAPTPAPTK